MSDGGVPDRQASNVRSGSGVRTSDQDADRVPKVRIDKVEGARALGDAHKDTQRIKVGRASG